MAPVVAAADLSSISSRAALLCPSAPRAQLNGRRWSGERSGDVPTQGEWGDAKVCCAPRISIAPHAGQDAASALIPFNAVAVGMAVSRRFPRCKSFPARVLRPRAPRFPESCVTHDSQHKRRLPMALISKHRPRKLTRPITKTPHDDPYAVGFGTTLAKVFASCLTPTVRSRRCHRGVRGPASGTSSSGKSWVRESAHRQAANRAASGRSAEPQA
jgi:hypothetical protein